MIDWKKVARIQKEDAFLLEEDRKAVRRRCILVQQNVSRAIKAMRPIAKETGTVRKFNKVSECLPCINDMLSFYGLDSSRYGEFRGMLEGNLFGKDTQKQVCEKMYNRLVSLETDIYISERRGLLYPQFVYSFLPSNVSIRTIGGKFKRVIQHFVEMKRNSINVKMYVSSCLEKDYPRIESRLRKVFRCGGERERLMAALALITMQTGIRPGVKVGTVYSHEDDSDIETFGLTTLRKEHVSFTETGFRFEFVGKKGTMNVFVVSDPELTEFMKGQMQMDELFSVGGEKAGYDAMFRFFSEEVKYMPSDFRKRIANVTLHNELSKYAGGDVEAFLSDVYSNVAVALNHKTSDGSVAVNSYCNPRVLLHWLSADGCGFADAVSEAEFDASYRR